MAFQGSHWAGETDDVGDAGVTHDRVMLSNAPGCGGRSVFWALAMGKATRAGQ